MMQMSGKFDHPVEFGEPGGDCHAIASVEMTASPRFYASIHRQKSDRKRPQADGFPSEQEQSSSLETAKFRAIETLSFYRSVVTTLEVHRTSQSRRGSGWCFSSWKQSDPDPELAHKLRDCVLSAKRNIDHIFCGGAKGLHRLLQETADRVQQATNEPQIACLMRQMELETEIRCHRRRDRAQYILNNMRAHMMSSIESTPGRYFSGEDFDSLVQMCFCLDDAANYHPNGNKAWEVWQNASLNQQEAPELTAAAVPPSDQPVLVPVVVPMLYTEQLQQWSELMPDYASAWFHERQSWEVMEHPPTLAMQRTMLWRYRVQQSLGIEHNPQALGTLQAYPCDGYPWDLMAFPDESSLSARSVYEVDRWLYAMAGLWMAHGPHAPSLWLDRDTSCNNYWASDGHLALIAGVGGNLPDMR